MRADLRRAYLGSVRQRARKVLTPVRKTEVSFARRSDWLTCFGFANSVSDRRGRAVVVANGRPDTLHNARYLRQCRLHEIRRARRATENGSLNVLCSLMTSSGVKDGRLCRFSC